MKLFLFKILIFLSLIALSVVVIFSQFDGHTDPFYLRFTTNQQNNLILGTSRAAQGLQPRVLNTYFDQPFFNYAFTVAHSPYGATYLKSIQKKLDPHTTDGIFIVTVDPWSISNLEKQPSDSLIFQEDTRFLATTPFVNMNPNIFYILENYSENYYHLIIPNKPTGMLLHKDGWLQLEANMDSVAVKTRTDHWLKTYRDINLPNYKFSKTRLDYLIKTIDLLKAHGRVYLVRLPISPGMYEIEAQLMPDFDKKMQSLEPLTSGYLDLTLENDDYDYVDGNHLYQDSGKVVSEKIAKWILSKNH